MKILSIETSSRLAGLSLLEDGKVRAAVSWAGQEIAGELIARLDSVLPANEQSAGIGLVVVSLGPGSWTGIRVGISFGAGLAAGWGADIAGVHLPESIFFGLEHTSLPICCVANAYQGKVYYSFRRRGALSMGAIKKADPEALVHNLKEPTLFAGPALDELDSSLFKSRYVRRAAPWFWYPQAPVNAAVILQKQAKHLPLPAVEPFYGR